MLFPDRGFTSIWGGCLKYIINYFIISLVFGPTIPSGVSLLAFWKAITACLVFVPKRLVSWPEEPAPDIETEYP